MIRLIIWAILVAFVISALLDGLANAQGTPAERVACHHDVLRFCKHELAGGPFSIGPCLSANKARLTAACRKVIEGHGL